MHLCNQIFESSSQNLCWIKWIPNDLWLRCINRVALMSHTSFFKRKDYCPKFCWKEAGELLLSVSWPGIAWFLWHCPAFCLNSSNSKTILMNAVFRWLLFSVSLSPQLRLEIFSSPSSIRSCNLPLAKDLSFCLFYKPDTQSVLTINKLNGLVEQNFSEISQTMKTNAHLFFRQASAQLVCVLELLSMPHFIDNLNPFHYSTLEYVGSKAENFLTMVSIEMQTSLRRQTQ